MSKLAELYQYRYLLSVLISSELKLRYRRSTLGFLWSMLNPLLMMIVITAVFSQVMRFQVHDYALLLLAGILPWTFISQTVSNSLMSIISKGSLLQKVYVPKSIFPLAGAAANLVNFVLSLVPLLGIGLVFGHGLSLSLIFLPVATLFVAMFACGLTLLFSCLNVFFRDFTHMTDVLMQALFYASPIIYTVEMVPEKFRPIFRFNPVSSLVECFRAPIYRGTFPTWADIGFAFGAGCLSLLIGGYVFFRNENEFVLRV
ncbi:MAG: ABC transporter permease [Clostridia bacterium]|nr:ABC transporter permease [Deltaproteobacteria bacterium]